LHFYLDRRTIAMGGTITLVLCNLLSATKVEALASISALYSETDHRKLIWILLIQSIDIEYIKEKDISLMPSLDYDFRRCTISPRPDIICLGEEFTVPDDGTVS